jgi:putative heme-binding domain-containing protein
LFYRVSKLGGGRMPRLGSSEVDARGAHLIHDWIAQLSPQGKAHVLARQAAAESVLSGSPEQREAGIKGLTASTSDALVLAQWLSGRAPESEVRRETVALTQDHPAVEIRDLFERFVPASQRTKRLGEVVNQAELLRLEADAGRGKNVFFNNAAAACKNCHRIGETGQPLGPELTTIGKKYRKDQLLQHILEPSQFIEPKYVPYLLETSAGQIFTGLVVEQTDTQVVLQDAQNKKHTIPAGEVELLVRQQKSLMPELLLRDMTRQEVADLLAYLSSLK